MSTAYRIIETSRNLIIISNYMDCPSGYINPRSRTIAKSLLISGLM